MLIIPHVSAQLFPRNYLEVFDGIMVILLALISIAAAALIAPLCIFNFRRRGRSDSKADIVVNNKWSTHDLCHECQSLGLGLPYLDDRTVRYRIHIVVGARCPLCLYFLSVLFDDSIKAVPTVAEESVTVTVDSVPDRHWDKSQRRITFADDTKLAVLQRFALHPILEHDGVGTFVTYRTIDKHEVDISLLKSWVKYCRDHHDKTCSHQDILGGQSIPDDHGFKVIDCTTRRIIKARIRDLSYVALSYVWGKHSAQEVDSSPNCLPLSLPSTIEDAIKLTIQLGFQYLWVDKYCIDQSDPEDVQNQVLMMDVIYHAASVTIIAAAGSDSTYGLPGIGAPRTLPNSICLDGTTWIANRQKRKYPIRSSVWFSRGWTYQEAFFSRRRLIFTEQQVIFECNAMSCYEILRIDFEKAHRSHEPILGNVHSIQLRINGTWNYTMYIEAYTKRSLSHQSDTLKALRGLLRSFTTKTEPWQQYWGILVTPLEYWDYVPGGSADAEHVAMALSYGLCWHVNVEDSPSRHIVRREGFPSWSWSGWLAAVMFPWTGWQEDSEINVPRQYHVLKTDGSRAVLTEDLAARIFLDENFASGYTSKLCFKADVFDLELRYLKDGIDHWDNHNPRPKDDLKSHFAVKVNTGQKDGLPDVLDSMAHHWPLLVTPHVEEGDAMYLSLCTQVFQCVILSKHWGLVVRERAGVFERVGLLRLFCERTSMDLPELERSHLQDYFPSVSREIVLG
ncbi:HET-domain-containing protein [Ophiobolus disseminans]|uniref:HET-domain-containing protein n=1 Tax=Ophiobolus disseminans TaxID=1469910 RepID=A0A6A7A3Z0_9PLEO|nr:HET-domain-containing protein [Ophiobolus disseminans]